jgi:hypothetical protein
MSSVVGLGIATCGTRGFYLWGVRVGVAYLLRFLEGRATLHIVLACWWIDMGLTVGLDASL